MDHDDPNHLSHHHSPHQHGPKVISIGFLEHFAPLHHVAVDLVGRTVRTLLSTSACVPDVEIVLDVSVVDGAKCLTVHTTRCVENRTRLHLDVMGIAVAPGQSCWLPLLEHDPAVAFVSASAFPAEGDHQSETSEGARSLSHQQQVSFQPLTELRLRPALLQRRHGSLRPPSLGPNPSQTRAQSAGADPTQMMRHGWTRPLSQRMENAASSSSSSSSSSHTSKYSHTRADPADATHEWSYPIPIGGADAAALNNDDDADDASVNSNASAVVHRVWCAPQQRSVAFQEGVMHFTVRARHEAAASSSSSAGSARIVRFEIAAPFVFENLLPCDLELSLSFPALIEAQTAASIEEMGLNGPVGSSSASASSSSGASALYSPRNANSGSNASAKRQPQSLLRWASVRLPREATIECYAADPMRYACVCFAHLC